MKLKQFVKWTVLAAVVVAAGLFAIVVDDEGRHLWETTYVGGTNDLFR